MTELRKKILIDPLNAARAAEFDTLFQVPVWNDIAHSEIHAGDFFRTWAAKPSMSNGETIILAFMTPDGIKRVHMYVNFATLAGAHYEVIEGPTWLTDTGTLTDIFNAKREAEMNSSVLLEDKSATPAWTASDQVLLDPDSFADGEVVDTDYIFGAAQKGGGELRGEHEIPLKPDTQYGIVLTADGSSNGGFLKLAWYEHTDA